MSEYLPIKDWFKFRRGEVVRVRMRASYPRLNGIYQLKKIARTSNFPYVVEHEGEKIILQKNEVFKLGRIDTPEETTHDQ